MLNDQLTTTASAPPPHMFTEKEKFNDLKKHAPSVKTSSKNVDNLENANHLCFSNTESGNKANNTFYYSLLYKLQHITQVPYV